VLPALLSGAYDLPWWGYALEALGLTQVTIAALTTPSRSPS
jgi:hypothetical protein